MLAGVDRQLQFGPDPVIGGDQQRIVIARGLQIEEAAEAADFGIGAGARGRLGEWRNGLHQRIACGD